jgi:hypothetical protein
MRRESNNTQVAPEKGVPLIVSLYCLIESPVIVLISLFGDVSPASVEIGDELKDGAFGTRESPIQQTHPTPSHSRVMR